MNTLNSFLHLWKVIFQYYLFCLITTLIAAYIWNWNIAILILAVELFFHVIWWPDLKSQLLNTLPESHEFCPTHPELYPQLDHRLLDQYTTDLESLGFIQIKDFSLGINANTPSFSRLFFNPQQQCFAEVFQLFNSDQKPIIPLYTTLTSTFANNWKLITTQVKPNGISWMSQNPQCFGSCHPNIPPTELWTKHLQKRQEILETTQINLLNLEENYWNFYNSEQQRLSQEKRRIFRKKNILLAIIQGTLFDLNPKFEWWGEYDQWIKKKGAGKILE